MKTKFLSGIFLILLCTGSYAQNLTGTWEGAGGSGGGYCKMVILHIGDSLFGYTYDVGMGYCKANFSGEYNNSTKKLTVKNIDFIERKGPHSLSIYNLNYSENGTTEFLKGRISAKTVGAKLLSFGLPTQVHYRKINQAIDTTVLIAATIEQYKDKVQQSTAVTPAVVVVTPLPVKDTVQINTATALDLSVIKESRKSEVETVITTTADSIRIILFDNGEIDGDTITVFYNGKIIVNQLLLTEKPFEIIMPIPKNGALQIIELLANNLGSIPPNTAYMQIWTGVKKYEFRLSSDYKTNARIDVQYKAE